MITPSPYLYSPLGGAGIVTCCDAPGRYGSSQPYITCSLSPITSLPHKWKFQTHCPEHTCHKHWTIIYLRYHLTIVITSPRNCSRYHTISKTRPMFRDIITMCTPDISLIPQLTIKSHYQNFDLFHHIHRIHWNTFSRLFLVTFQTVICAPCREQLAADNGKHTALVRPQTIARWSPRI